MLVIGLTGGIGTGKSLVSRMLQEHGATIIDADLVGHEAYTPHTETWQVVVDTFGDVLAEDGQIDRRKLGAIVFSDPKQLEKLNAIMHPRMYKMIEERIQGHQAGGAETIVVEAAILIEAKWTPLVDEVWVTTAPEDQVIDRIKGRNNMGEDAARARINSQMSSEERVRHANVSIANDGSMDQLRDTVDGLWDSRVSTNQGE
jgi:dephospho-CoA kinase